MFMLFIHRNDFTYNVNSRLMPEVMFFRRFRGGLLERGLNSCLGPLLFLVYINDLPQAVQNSTIAMYADDTSLSYRSDDVQKLNESMNKDLTSIFEWLKGNRLSLNVTKTKAMAILTKQKEKWLSENSKELFLSIQEERIDNAQFTKYLGVQMDNNLNWKGHIKALSIKISRAIGFLKHAKNF